MFRGVVWLIVCLSRVCALKKSTAEWIDVQSVVEILGAQKHFIRWGPDRGVKKVTIVKYVNITL